jgi:hypothetical protein
MAARSCAWISAPISEACRLAAVKTTPWRITQGSATPTGMSGAARRASPEMAETSCSASPGCGVEMLPSGVSSRPEPGSTAAYLIDEPPTSPRASHVFLVLIPRAAFALASLSARRISHADSATPMATTAQDGGQRVDVDSRPAAPNSEHGQPDPGPATN